MTLWANRQISTGWFIPAGGKGRRGHTHQEPEEVTIPRLFSSKRLAERALKAWVEGKWYESFETSYSTGEWESYGPEPEKGTNRDPKDFETIQLELEVR